MTRSELRVALATENDDVDRVFFAALLGLVLDRTIKPFETDLRFSGIQSVRSQAPILLGRAYDDGVRHALIAVDNDSRDSLNVGNRPEHEETHVRDQQMMVPNRACRVCWLEANLPTSWREKGGLLCLAVPAQAIETWLLWLREYPFDELPERAFSVNAMKRWFFGKEKTDVETRRAMALEVLARPDALTRLRERPSFVRFEGQALSWLTAEGATAPSP